MFLARVEGSVVATKKDASMSGRKLLLVRPQLVDDKDPTQFRPGMNTIVAVDSVGCRVIDAKRVEMGLPVTAGYITRNSPFAAATRHEIGLRCPGQSAGSGKEKM